MELRLPADVLDGMFTGRVNAMQAAIDGQARPSRGDTVKAMTLQQLQDDLGRCYRAAREERRRPRRSGRRSGSGGALPRRGGGRGRRPARASSSQVVNELYAQQLITATGGNVSVRVPGRDEIWITPSQLFKGDLRPELLVRIDLDGRPARRRRRARRRASA